jgi:hypothetical protein
VTRGEPGQASPEALLDGPGQRDRHRQAEPAGYLGRAQAPWQLEQGERVAVGFGHDPIQHRLIEPIGKDRSEQSPRICVGQAVDDHLGEAADVIGQLARAERNATASFARRRATKPTPCPEARSSP